MRICISCETALWSSASCFAPRLDRHLCAVAAQVKALTLPPKNPRKHTHLFLILDPRAGIRGCHSVRKPQWRNPTGSRLLKIFSDIQYLHVGNPRLTVKVNSRHIFTSAMHKSLGLFGPSATKPAAVRYLMKHMDFFYFLYLLVNHHAQRSLIRCRRAQSSGAGARFHFSLRFPVTPFFFSAIKIKPNGFIWTSRLTSPSCLFSN